MPKTPVLLQQVPKPPQDEILQLEKMQEARRLLQAQALGQQKKAGLLSNKCLKLGSTIDFYPYWEVWDTSTILHMHLHDPTMFDPSG